MKKLLFLLSVIVACLPFAACSDSHEGMEPEVSIGANDPMEEEIEYDVFKEIGLTENAKLALPGANEFSLNLFKKAFVGEYESPNVCVSPLSIYVATSMLANGDNGESAKKVLKVLGFGNFEIGHQCIDELCETLIAELGSVDRLTTVSLANSVWYNPVYNIKSDFAKMTQNVFYGEIIAKDPAGESGMAAINEWIYEKTFNKLQNFLEKPLSGDVALVNTCYFKTPWEVKFSKDKTKKDLFYDNDHGRELDMMYAKNWLRIYQTDNFSAVKLFSGNSNYSLTAIMPEGINTLDALCKTLTQDYIKNIDERVELKYAELRFPKMSVDFKLDLKNIFEEFVPSFSLMEFKDIADIPLIVNSIPHGVKLDIDEDGIEGASATIFDMIMSGGTTPKEISLNFNRPYLYIIKEESTGVILFIGVFHGVA